MQIFWEWNWIETIIEAVEWSAYSHNILGNVYCFSQMWKSIHYRNTKVYFGIVFISNIEYIVYFNWNTISYNDPVNSITIVFKLQFRLSIYSESFNYIQIEGLRVLRFKLNTAKK